MAGFNRKKVIQKEQPRAIYVGRIEDSESYYSKHPAWSFKAIPHRTKVCNIT